MLKIKYKTILLIIFCLLVLSLQVITAQSLPLQDTIIMVDPGHGGYWKIQKLWNDYKC